MLECVNSLLDGGKLFRLDFPACYVLQLVDTASKELGPVVNLVDPVLQLAYHVSEIFALAFELVLLLKQFYNAVEFNNVDVKLLQFVN